MKTRDPQKPTARERLYRLPEGYRCRHCGLPVSQWACGKGTYLKHQGSGSAVRACGRTLVSADLLVVKFAWPAAKKPQATLADATLPVHEIGVLFARPCAECDEHELGEANRQDHGCVWEDRTRVYGSRDVARRRAAEEAQKPGATGTWTVYAITGAGTEEREEIVWTDARRAP